MKINMKVKSMYWLYNILLLCYWATLIPVLIYRLIREEGFYQRIKQSIGYLPQDLREKITDRHAIWVHAASVGEIVAASPIIREMRKTHPNEVILVSVVTATGFRMAHQIIDGADGILYFPLDLPYLTNRILSIVNPKIIVLVETEIWPNFLRIAAHKRIPVMMMNGRISQRSAVRYRMITFFTKRVLSSIRVFCMQSRIDGQYIIDIGAESTRPGSMPLTAEEEQARLLPYLRELVPISPVPLSVDTYHASTARLAADCGVHMLNDVWGLQYAGEPAGAMAAVAAETGLPIIVMHNQQGQQYDGDVISIMQAFFRRSLHIAAQAGVKRENIILDPGIGLCFGKDTPTNLLVQRRLRELTVIDGEAYPLLLACSRKGFIGDVLGLPSDERDLATGAAGVVGILNDACMLRVHAVEPMAQMAAITDAIRGVR